MASPRSAVGVVLIELLVAVVVIMILVTWWIAPFGRSVSAAAVAQDLVRFVSVTRWRAVAAGTAKTLLAAGSTPPSLVLVSDFVCEIEDASVLWSAPARVSVAWPRMGLVFAPDGRPRRCDGSGVGNTTIVIEGPRGDRAAVIVASLGRVRWEPR